MFDGNKQKIADILKNMNPGMDEKRLVNEFYGRKYKLLFLVFSIGIAISIVLFFQDMSKKNIDENGSIVRDGYGGSSKTLYTVVETEEFEDVEIDVEVGHKEYTLKELDDLFSEIKSWLPDEIKGKNESLDRIVDDLNFVPTYKDSEISLTYSISDYQLIDGNGVINKDEVEEPKPVSVSVLMAYGNIEEKMNIDIVIIPRELTPLEQFKKNVIEVLQKENENQKNTDSLILPNEIDGKKVLFREKKSRRFLAAFLLSIMATVFICFGIDDDLRKQYEKRKESLLFSYPEFVSKLALLMGAGMSLSGAIRRIHMDEKNKTQPLYTEINIFVHNLDNGILEEKAIEEFGRRTRLPEYRKFCALLLLNLKKGSMNLKAMLESESELAFEKHQAQIRKMGEEAGTKLLIPMVMMLAVVIAIIMIPAFLTYQI